MVTSVCVYSERSVERDFGKKLIKMLIHVQWHRTSSGGLINFV